MKQKFSKAWKGSKQPRKQRKYIANAPLHIKRKLLSVNLSKELREKYKKRNVIVRKGDVVKVFNGKFKGTKGKVLEIKTKTGKIYMENVQTKKMDGSKTNVPLKASNLQIIELKLDDKKRQESLSAKSAPEKKVESKETKTESTKKKGEKNNAPKKK